MNDVDQVAEIATEPVLTFRHEVAGVAAAPRRAAS
jgi:hypothetical protein